MRALLDEEIEESFEGVILNRGREYLRGRRVLEIHAQPDGGVSATVKGSRARPYTVHLELMVGAETWVRTTCTCPYETQCKHGAAAALKLRASVNERPQAVPAAWLPHELRRWLEGVRAGQDPTAAVPGSKQMLCYLLELRRADSNPPKIVLVPFNRRLHASGSHGVPTKYNLSGVANGQFQKHVGEFDRRLLADLHRNAQEWYGQQEFVLSGPNGARLLKDLLITGRCFYHSLETAPLREGPSRGAALAWRTDPRGNQLPVLDAGDGCVALPLSPPWYIDPETSTCGPIESEIDPGLLASLLRAPAVPPEYTAPIREGLLSAGVPVGFLPAEPLAIERISPRPTAHIRLELVSCPDDSYRMGGQPTLIPFADLSFDYDGHRVAPSDQDEVRRVSEGRVCVVVRDTEQEDRYARRMNSYGWLSAGFVYTANVPAERRGSLCMSPSAGVDHLEQYDAFLRGAVPKLRAEDWAVEVVGDLHYVGRDHIQWEFGVESESGNNWFELMLGIRLGGELVDLRKLLPQLLKRDTPLYRYGYGAKLPETDPVVTLPNGAVISIPRKRVDAILEPLIELFGEVALWPDALRLPSSRLGDTDRIEELATAAGVQWRSSEQIEDLRKRLADRGSVSPLAAPKGFHGELRDYQREGLAWLQFLREFGFDGILADDMGLGKTVQVLAHLQCERLAGRCDRPCLVVAPTSTLPNWRREAARFVPDLKVVTLHGPDRTGAYAGLAGADLALTNYAILSRDRAKLVAQAFHIVVLDEAQNVKNAATTSAKAARELNARHRLCLSGTPVENHLDELWSLFEFLMPGFLGSAQSFRREFRTPIEKKGDAVARQRLVRRVRPFMLRRTKQQVAAELPPKTLIVETVDFGDAQRDLYELVRVAMDQQIRALLAAQGLDKSRIHVLAALLKLRQVCCDPRLVKLESAQSVGESAKFERLFEMLPVLLEEGRHILLFSQFTSMLDLIEGRLKEEGIPWVRISGDTVDRDTPVQRFQSGKVPLFLISLKAGGTGLNLVAADTVIHFDRWWNPAVERQATDRAHRIGQDKPVMVYKLVASGTVEEKILDLQERKGALAEAILEGSENALAALSQDDLAWLLTPK